MPRGGVERGGRLCSNENKWIRICVSRRPGHLRRLVGIGSYSTVAAIRILPLWANSAVGTRNLYSSTAMQNERKIRSYYSHLLGRINPVYKW